jgi:hypothetical protein
VKKTAVLIAFQDGSKKDHLVTDAFAIPEINIEHKMRLTDNFTIYTAQLVAIKEALNWIARNYHSYPHTRFLICSYSKSSLESLKSGDSNSRPNLQVLVLEFRERPIHQTADIPIRYIGRLVSDRYPIRYDIMFLLFQIF